MNFTIALIVKNEVKNLDHLFKDLQPFMEAGGDVVFLDTVSTDNTVQKAKSLGFRIHISDISFIDTISDKNYEKIKTYTDINLSKCYFNFAKARNYIHSFVNTNMILQLDASQHIINFDFKYINDKIKNDKILKFSYMCYYGCENSFILNKIGRFYHKLEYTWIRPVHEILDSKRNIQEYDLSENILSIKHLKNQKDRNYLVGLFDDFFKNPKVPRCVYYLARDLFYIANYRSCISIATTFLSIDRNKIWMPELAGIYILIGDCNKALNNNTLAIENYESAHNEFNGMRMPLIKMAEIYITLKSYKKALDLLYSCLKIKKESAFTELEIYYTYYPHKLIYDICYILKDEDIKYNNIGKINLNKCIEYDKNFQTDLILFSDVSENRENIIVFYLSYAGIRDNNIYGSELACIKLSEALNLKGYKIFIVDDICRPKTTCINNITYIDIHKFNSIKNMYIIDILILSRYINYFISYNLNPKKIFLWIHDITICPFYEGGTFNNNGYSFLKHNINNIDKFITLTDWHTDKFLQLYDFIPTEKIVVIGNGITINDSDTETEIKKIPFRFIWTSALNRNIEITINCFLEVSKLIENAELHIFRDIIGYESYIEKFKLNTNIFFHGSVSHDIILAEFKKSSIWLYPTFWEETYCISALEAQLNKTLCFYNPIGSLPEVISDRGCVIPANLNPYELAIFIINTINNKELCNKLLINGYNFALSRDWNRVADSWIEIFI